MCSSDLSTGSALAALSLPLRMPGLRGIGVGSVAFLAPASALAVLAAAALDPGHDPLSDYVSWLSAGPYWWLAALGVAGLGLSAAAEGVHASRILSGPPRQATAAFLFCTAALAAANLALPSRGVGEPLWRTAAHVGLATGAYASIVGAALLLAWCQRRNKLLGPATAPWTVALLVGLTALGLASAHARLVGTGPDLRGLGQLILMALAAGWMAVASRLAAAPTA